MKIKLKFKALSFLMAGLQETQMWVIYQMASGENLRDSVAKVDLIKIIAFLLKQLDWIEGYLLCWNFKSSSDRTS